MMHETKRVLETKVVDGQIFELRCTVGVEARYSRGRGSLRKVTEYSVVNVTAAKRGEDDVRNLWGVRTKAEALKAYKALDVKAVVVETMGADAFKRIFG